MNEVSKQKEKPGGHNQLVNEGSAARTRPTSVEEIMLRRKRRESVENVKEKTVVTAHSLGNDPVEKPSDYTESEKEYDRSQKVSCEERAKASSRKKENAIATSREEKPMKKDLAGAAQLLTNHLDDKVSDYNASEKGNDRSKKVWYEEQVKDSSRKQEDTISRSSEEKLMKEEPVGTAQLLGHGLVEKVSGYRVSEKGHGRSKKLRHDERVKDSSRRKEEAISSSRDEKTVKEDPLGTAQLLGHDLVEKNRASEKGHNISMKVRHDERVKDSSRKKEEAISSSTDKNILKEDPVETAQLLGHGLDEKDRAEKGHDRSKSVRHEEHVKDSARKKEEAISSSRDHKPMKEDPVGAVQLLGYDPVEKVSDCYASEIGYERSGGLRREKHVKDSLRKKEDVISSSREENSMKEDLVGTDQLLSKDLVENVPDYHASQKGYNRSNKSRREKRENSRKKEAISSSREEILRKEEPLRTAQLLGSDLFDKISDYHESKKSHARSEKLRHEERVKDSSRKKEEAISSSREERLDKPKREEKPAADRKRKAEGQSSTAETKFLEEHNKDRRRKKEETNSSCREKRLDKKIKKEDLAANRKVRVEGECPTTEIKTMSDRDGLVMDTKMKAKRESHAPKTNERQIHLKAREQARSALENVPTSRKSLRSLVVADIVQDEDCMKPDNENKRKNQNGDHKKNRERDMSKRHDPGKVHSVEVSERWEKREQPNSHQCDMKEKRRRSRSRDHGEDKQRRSSPLQGAEKASSHHTKYHERSENAVKDRSRKLQLNDYENKVPSTVNNKSRRFCTSKSELGGYSPRKRREEASAKAASPPNLSSEKKFAKWDLTPSVTAGIVSGTAFSGLQAANQTVYPAISEASLTLLKPFMEVPFVMPLARQTTSVDSVQLTESTRRMRRLYIENVPDSASEKSLIECFNGYMLSSGSNHIQGSEPCISCTINKEKHQALVEFLTPQDASAALSLDGCSFAGSNLNIRRPKDYVETTSGELEKKEPATNAVSDNVEDSSNKIFVGGFPKAISSEMLMEIVGVFGPLKAFRYVGNSDLNQRCAFLEYTDGSVTLKACAGLNGMKLGGSVIAAVCAVPDAPYVKENENPPFYGIPEHAKPLLDKPKHILKLKNVVDPEDLPSLSEAEVKEILEDVRLECARFGVTKSINIVEHHSKDISGSQTNVSFILESTDSKEMNVSVVQEKDEGSKKADDIADKIVDTVMPNSVIGEDTLCEPSSDIAIKTDTQANEDHHSAKHDNCEKTVGESAQDDNPEEVGSVRGVKTRSDACNKIEVEKDPEDVFEPGCIFIEYRRPEATREAAHSLHGRLYESRIVKAEYVSKELYQIRFPSG